MIDPFKPTGFCIECGEDGTRVGEGVESEMYNVLIMRCAKCSTLHQVSVHLNSDFHKFKPFDIMIAPTLGEIKAIKGHLKILHDRTRNIDEQITCHEHLKNDIEREIELAEEHLHRHSLHTILRMMEMIFLVVKKGGADLALYLTNIEREG